MSRQAAASPAGIIRLPQRLESLQKAIEEDDWTKITQISHTLKGTAANYGFEQLSHVARQIESSSQLKNKESALKLSESLDALIKRAEAGLTTSR